MSPRDVFPEFAAAMPAAGTTWTDGTIEGFVTDTASGPVAYAAGDEDALEELRRTCTEAGLVVEWARDGERVLRVARQPAAVALLDADEAAMCTGWDRVLG